MKKKSVGTPYPKLTNKQKTKMALIAEQTATQEFKIIATGAHIARCIRVIDLGTQHSEFFQKDIHKVMLTFELPNELIEDKEGNMMPMLISKEYSLSLHEKSKLYEHLVSWRGKKFTDDELRGFDMSKVAGAPCMLAISHTESKGKTYANIDTIMSVLKGVPVPDVSHEVFTYLIEDGVGGNFNKLPEWIQLKIQKARELSTPTSEEVKEIVKQEFSQVPDSDLPF